MLHSYLLHICLIIVLIAVSLGLFIIVHLHNAHFYEDLSTQLEVPSNRIKDHESAVAEHSKSGNRMYGVVFDAGSTGSRVHVFELSPLKLAYGSSYSLTDELFEQVKPGLSSYADNPAQAAESLQPLIRAAENWLPKDTCHSTSVVLRATAGLRLLSSTKADDILSAVRGKLSTSCFLKSQNAVSILDGHLEGLYLWISLNFMTNRMPNLSDQRPEASEDTQALSRTVGTLDLGGGSTQITFAPGHSYTLMDAPDGYATSIDSGKEVPKEERKLGKHIYSHSYLGLGLMSARYSMLHTTLKRLPPSQFNVDNRLHTACFPRNTTVNWSHGGREFAIQHLSLVAAQQTMLEVEMSQASRLLEMPGKSNQLLTICYAQALNTLRDPVDGKSTAPTYQPNGFVVHRPAEIIDREFFAFSYIFDLALSVGLIKDPAMGGQVSVRQFRDAADRVCNAPNPLEPFECMDLCFITALLRDGYGFPWDKQITLQKKVKQFEISWGLGALFAELSARQQQHV